MKPDKFVQPTHYNLDHLQHSELRHYTFHHTIPETYPHGVSPAHSIALQYKFYTAPTEPQHLSSQSQTLARGRPPLAVRPTSAAREGSSHVSESEPPSEDGSPSPHIESQSANRALETNAESGIRGRPRSSRPHPTNSPPRSQPTPKNLTNIPGGRGKYRSKPPSLAVFPSTSLRPLNSARIVSPGPAGSSSKSPSPRKRAYEFDGVIITKKPRKLGSPQRKPEEPTPRAQVSHTPSANAVDGGLPSAPHHPSGENHNKQNSDLASALTAAFAINDQVNKRSLLHERLPKRSARKSTPISVEDVQPALPPLLPPTRWNTAAAKEYWDTIDAGLNTRVLACRFPKHHDNATGIVVMEDRRLRSHLRKYLADDTVLWTSPQNSTGMMSNPVARLSVPAMIKYRTEELYGRGSMNATRPGVAREASASDARRHED